MRAPQLCALVTKTGRGSRRLPPDGRKKYHNTILLYYDYYEIINIERTPPPPTNVHPTPPRHTMLSDMYLYYIRVYYIIMCTGRSIGRFNFPVSIYHYGIRLSDDAFIIIYCCVFYRPTVCRSPICEIHETRHYCADYYNIIAAGHVKCKRLPARAGRP